MGRYKFTGTFRDGSGNIVAGGTVSVFESGTTTAATIYETATGTTAVNSTTSGTDGVFTFYIMEGDYYGDHTRKLILSKTGFSAKTYDYTEPTDFYNGAFTLATIEAALTAIGTTNKATMLLRPGTWAVTADLTIPANVTLKIPAGAVLSIATGKTLTINGPFEAGLYQVFDCVGTGKVVFGLSNNPRVYVKWFGALGDGTHDDTAPIQAAIDAARSTSYSIPVYLTKGAYKITASLVLPNHTTITSDNLVIEETYIFTTESIPILTNEDTSNCQSVNLSNFAIRGGTYGIQIGLDAGTAYQSKFKLHNFSIDNTSVAGFYCTKEFIANDFSNVTFNRTTNGIWVDAGAATVSSFRNCNFLYITGVSAHFVIGQAIEFDGCIFEGSDTPDPAGDVISLVGCRSTRFANCYFENTNHTILRETSSSWTTIFENCRFTGNLDTGVWVPVEFVSDGIVNFQNCEIYYEGTIATSKQIGPAAVCLLGHNNYFNQQDSNTYYRNDSRIELLTKQVAIQNGVLVDALVFYRGLYTESLDLMHSLHGTITLMMHGCNAAGTDLFIISRRYPFTVSAIGNTNMTLIIGTPITNDVDPLNGVITFQSKAGSADASTVTLEIGYDASGETLNANSYVRLYMEAVSNYTVDTSIYTKILAQVMLA